MNNKNKVLKYINNRSDLYLCDDCISEVLSIYPRQQINAICNDLAKENLIFREKDICKKCNKYKILNKNLKIPQQLSYQEKKIKIMNNYKFEDLAKTEIENKLKIKLEKPYPLMIGVSEKSKKQHNFDLGNEKYIIECKSHTWTSGNNTPSAKLTIWNEAMYYFFLAPSFYKKIFFILKDYNKKREMTLAQYYIKIYKHLIPNDVEFWEFDTEKNKIQILK